MSRKVYIDNMPLEQALAMLMDRLIAIDALGVEAEKIHVLDAQGRVTAEPVWAVKSSPHYQASAMDGIAVLASATFGASETTPVQLTKGHDFVEVDTGDPVPLEFDAVIMIEDVNYKNAETAEIIAPATPWQHVRSVGEDVVASQMMLPAGFPIGPYEIGAFLTAGVTRVNSARKPKVVIIPTGTEMVEPGAETGQAGEITESNSRVLAGLSQSWGAEPLRFAIAVDDRETLKKAVQKASEQADIVIICSGSSAGREDFTADTIAELGELLLHGLATRPGKPAILGMINGKPVIGVPGYPVSAALVFELFARPLISAKLGIAVPESDMVQAKIARKIASNMGVDEFIHVNVGRVGDDYLAFPLNRGAGITTSLVKSDGMLVIPRGTEGYQPGSIVNIRLARPREVIDRTILTIGSHDMALDYLGNIMWKGDRLRLSSTNVGSMGGIMALKRRETHFAGIHLLDTVTGEYNVSYLDKYLRGEKLLLINLVIREQGIMVKPGNPLAIKGIDDLVRPEVRFVNRQSGAGTRILLDYLLGQQSLNAEQISGYQREEYSHLAVAAAVANNTADAALGIYASAHAMNLDFIPVAEERYDLCILPELIGQEKLDAIRRAIASNEFASEVLAFGGYDLSLSGQIMWES
ncbi:MAG: molybdopterin biosynthesis protein [Acidobacteriota bacterium]